MIFFFIVAIFPVPAANIPGSTEFFHTRLALFGVYPAQWDICCFFLTPSQGFFALGGKIATESPMQQLRSKMFQVQLQSEEVTPPTSHE